MVGKKEIRFAGSFYEGIEKETAKEKHSHDKALPETSIEGGENNPKGLCCEERRKIAHFHESVGERKKTGKKIQFFMKEWQQKKKYSRYNAAPKGER